METRRGEANRGVFVGNSGDDAWCKFNQGYGGQMRGKNEPSVVVKPFGKTKDGQLVQQYTLTGAGGVVMDVIDFGGNFLTDKIPGKCGRNLCHRGGLALETQHAPDSPNQPGFPSTILRPGAVYKTVTEYRFGAK